LIGSVATTFDLISHEELRDTIRTVNVFARVSPEHKLRLTDTAERNC
jgi:magnesium-transporting ATPase (P-type)